MCPGGIPVGSSFAGCCAWRRMKLVPPCDRVHYKRISSSIRPPYMTKATLEYLRFEIPARLPSETLKKVVQNTLQHADDLDVEKICEAIRRGERSRQGWSMILQHGALQRCRIKVKFSSGKLHFYLDGSLYAANSMVECPLRPYVYSLNLDNTYKYIGYRYAVGPTKGPAQHRYIASSVLVLFWLLNGGEAPPPAKVGEDAARERKKRQPL